MHSVLVVPGILAEGTQVPLEDDERHHLKVRRAAPGDPVRAFDGAGAVASGTLTVNHDGFAPLLGEVRHVPEPASFTLIVGAGDKERFGWLAEKAAELAVTHLIPLESERTRSVAGGIRESHVAALQRRARQAIKQSQAPWAPRVHPPEGVEAAATRGAQTRRWLADASAEPPSAIATDTWVTVVVGPEGGLTEAERRIFVDAGFKPVRLAPDVLRFETAALAAASVVASQRPRRSHE